MKFQMQEINFDLYVSSHMIKWIQKNIFWAELSTSYVKK